MSNTRTKVVECSTDFVDRFAIDSVLIFARLRCRTEYSVELTLPKPTHRDPRVYGNEKIGHASATGSYFALADGVLELT